MRILLRLFVSFLLLFPALWSSLSAQTIVGKWGKVSLEDLNATSYGFAPGADAIVLFDQGVWMPQNIDVGSARLAHHYHIKILTPAGVTQARQTIRFAKGERVASLRAQTHRLVNGKKKRYQLAVGNLPDSTLSTDSLCKHFVLPDVQPGDILEVRYSLVTPRGDILRPWYFQTSIPTKYSEVRLSSFDYMSFRTKTLPTEFMAVSRNKWVRRYSPAITDNEYLVNVNDQRQQVRFQLMPFEQLTKEEEWRDLSYALESGTVTAVEERILRALGSLAYSLTRQSVTEEERVATIFRHLQKYMTWNESYSTSVSQDPGAVYRSRSGNSTDLNMLLFLLLESAELSPSRVFVSTRSHGAPVEDPFWGQFNHMIVKVMADGQEFYLDLTEQDLDYLWLSLDAANGKGWEIKDTLTQWIDIKPSTGSAIRSSLILDLSESGLISGQVKESYLGYPEKRWVEKMDVSGFLLDARDPFELEPKRESPYMLNIPAKDLQVDVSGDTIRLVPDLYSWRDGLPDFDPERVLPTHFSYPLSETVQMEISLPDGWTLVEPTGSRFLMEEEGFSLILQANQIGNTLRMGWTLERKQYAFDSSYSQDLFVFFYKVKEKLATPVLLVKEME